MDRRSFLATSATLPFLATMPASAPPPARPASPRRPALVGSDNGTRALRRAMELIAGGTDPLEAIVEGVAIVEDDPNDTSVGYGGLPNEDGVVQLDASVMHGPTHTSGAVAALERVKNPARVALQVLRRTDHALLVGQGALEFARRLGFPEQDLLTERSRNAWLKWKANLNPGDDWLDADQQQDLPGGVPRSHGTIHVSAVSAAGDLCGCTSTSGLSYKLAGRVGDSPIVGAGLFVDNEVGSAGSTGRGEAVIQSAGAFSVVRHMAEGVEPTEACLLVLTWIARHTKRPDLLNDRGEPRFDVVFYALRKDGAWGAASMRSGEKFVVCDGPEVRTITCPSLFQR